MAIIFPEAPQELQEAALRARDKYLREARRPADALPEMENPLPRYFAPGFTPAALQAAMMTDWACLFHHPRAELPLLAELNEETGRLDCAYTTSGLQPERLIAALRFAREKFGEDESFEARIIDIDSDAANTTVTGLWLHGRARGFVIPVFFNGIKPTLEDSPLRLLPLGTGTPARIGRMERAYRRHERRIAAEETFKVLRRERGLGTAWKNYAVSQLANLRDEGFIALSRGIEAAAARLQRHRRGSTSSHQL